MSGITIHEMSEALQQRLFTSNSMIVAEFNSRYEIDSQKDEIPIDIKTFDSEMDSLFVYKNSVVLSLGLDYEISENNKTIISLTPGSWGAENEHTIFDFIVLKNIKDGKYIDGVNIVDGALITDGTLTKEKLTPELRDSIHSLPDGGKLGSILVKNSDEDYDIKWTSNTICNLMINTFDNKSVEGVKVKFTNLSNDEFFIKPISGPITTIELTPGVKWRIEPMSKDGYKTPDSQIIVPIIGNINTVYFMYNTEMTNCSISIETEDGRPIDETTIYVRKVTDGTTQEIHTDGVQNVYDIELLVNTQYEIYAGTLSNYAESPKKIINTTTGATSVVLLRYLKDEIFCDIELTGIEVSSSDFVTVKFKDLKSDLEIFHKLTSRKDTVILRSNRSYEVTVMDEREGYIRPSVKYIKTGNNKSTITVPINYEISSNLLIVRLSTDDGEFVTGSSFTITDGDGYNRIITVGESGTATIHVTRFKTYHLSIDKKLGYQRPESKSITIEESTNVVDFIYRKINVYGFILDMSNSDPKTSVSYIEDATGFEPMKMTETGLTYGDWLDTFVIRDVRPCALLNGLRVGYLSEVEEGRMEDGSDIPKDADLMAEFKKKYYSISIQDNKLIFKISNYKLDNTYSCTAFLSEIDGKTECEYMYYGIYEATIDNSTIHSKPNREIRKMDDISIFRTMVKNKGEGYQLETLSKYNYINLLTILISGCGDIKSFMGKTDVNANVRTRESYPKFSWVLPNRTITEPTSVFFINNLHNSPRFIEGCYLNGLKEIRYRISGPYEPESNYSLLNSEFVKIGNGIYFNHIKNLTIGNNIVFPVYEKNLSDATNVNYVGSTVYANAEDNKNKKLIINNQAPGIDSEPGYFNFCFIDQNTYGTRLTYTGH